MTAVIEFIRAPDVVTISPATRASLAALGIHDVRGLVPRELFSWSALATGPAVRSRRWRSDPDHHHSSVWDMKNAIAAMTLPRPTHSMPARVIVILLALAVMTLLVTPAEALAHGVAAGDKGYIQNVTGFLPIPFMYLGAKHMVTGYDHLLFLLGVIFFLYRLKDIGLYVTLFAVGHSTTLLVGVLTGVSVSAYLIDAIIGLSVVYKALDNMNAFRRWFGVQPSTKAATLIFGLFHGFGLATKILEFQISPNGLIPNLVAFNVGVEIGQLLALSAILIAMSYWRRTSSFGRHAYTGNVVLMSAGFLLMGYQLAGYVLTSNS